MTAHCENAPNTDACDDGNACTSGDVCAGRSCGGQAVAGCCANACDCDDGNACTPDVCDPQTGSCASAAPACGVQGSVRYYREAAGAGLEPSIKGVPDVGIDHTGDGTADLGTDVSGPTPWAVSP